MNFARIPESQELARINAFVRESSKRMMDLRDAAAKYIQLAHLQYRAGTLNYIDVLDAECKNFDAQISVSNAIRDEYIALVNLYKVLGGGWQTPGAWFISRFVTGRSGRRR